MTNDTDSSHPTLRAGNESTDTVSTSRRKFLVGTAGGALAAGIGFGSVGTAAAEHSGDSAPPQLSVENPEGEQPRVVTPDGEQVVLNGVNTADPKRVDATAPARGKTATDVVDLATNAEKGWHAGSIRFPVQPQDIAETQPGTDVPPGTFTEAQLRSYLDNHLTPVVDKCANEGVYAIVDYHRHRGPAWAEGRTGPLNTDLQEEVTMFWEVVAAEYADRSHVLFEVYNEPSGNPNYGISGSELEEFWATWVEMAQPWVDAVRAESDNVVLIGSPRFSQMPWGALLQDFEGDDLGYTLHVYPSHPPDPDLEDAQTYDDFASPIYYGGDPDDAPYPLNPVYEDYPLFVTEWGYDPDGAPYAGGGVTKTADNDGDGEPETTVDPDYGQDIAAWFMENDLHWNTWVFDPIWFPRMMSRPFTDRSGTGTANPYESEPATYCEDVPCEWNALQGNYQGQFVKTLLQVVNTPSNDTTVVGDDPPQDLDGDGYYEDVNGDGAQNYADAVDLFRNNENPAVTEHYEAYDLNRNDEWDFDDIVDFFRSIGD